MAAIIWWIRRDLRLSDNQALVSALADGSPVVPLFVIDPDLLASPYVGEKRTAFLFDGLRLLHQELVARGSQLVVRRGQPVAVLRRVMAEAGANAIYAEQDYSPYARRRDGEVGKQLPLRLFGGLTAQAPQVVVAEDGTPFSEFAPFGRRWKELPPPVAAERLLPPMQMDSVSLVHSELISREPVLRQRFAFVAGEAEAQRRLRAFCSGAAPPVYQYEEWRDLMGEENTSGLSPYLRFGMISVRQVVVAAQRARHSAPSSRAAGNVELWLDELIRRDFYHAVLYHFPYVRRHSFQKRYRQLPYRNLTGQFDSWCLGQTGYPLVDAIMRQLTESGWISNRGRLVSASFLVKHLLIDWRWGERWFMQQSVDGDPAVNNGGWQWVAGTGGDAGPYSQVLNPIAQGRSFDADGAYVRRWVPELGAVPLKYLHEPWEMPVPVQRQAGCVIGRDYPWPVVDHEAARNRAVAIYRAAGQ